MPIIQYLKGQSKTFHILFCAALLVVVGVADYLTGSEVSFSVFYLLPVMLVTWFADKWIGLLFSAIGASIWFFADILAGHSYSHFLIPYWNAFVRFCIFFIVSYLLSKLRTYFMDTTVSSERDSSISVSSTGRSKVVARYANNKVVKGYTYNFSALRPSFHIESISADDQYGIVKVALRDLKAVFFVKDFEGNSSYNERKSFEAGQEVNDRRIEVSFKDGEVLVGSTASYDPNKQGFFLRPADPQSNNLKIFIISSAVKAVDFI